MIPIRRGDLRHIITIKTVVKTSDGFGGYTETEKRFHRCRAAIFPVSAKEILGNGQLEMQITHRIIIDYKDGITPDMTIYFGNRMFEITSIINLEERNVIQTLLCTEVYR